MSQQYFPIAAADTQQNEPRLKKSIAKISLFPEKLHIVIT